MPILRTNAHQSLFLFSLLLFFQEKLKRLIKYLNFKDMKSKSQKQASQDDDEVLEASGKYSVHVD